MELQENQAKTNSSSGAVSPAFGPLGFKDYPSLTTLVFILIFISAISLYMPIGVNQQFLIQIITSWLIFLLLTLAGLRWFLTEPRLIINKYGMIPLEEIDPELSQKIQQYAINLGVKYPPIAYYTADQRMRVMSFGTFRHNFIVINHREIEAYKKLQDNPSDPRFNSLDVILVHELAHLLNGDNWKYRLSKYIVWMVLMLSFILLLSLSSSTASQKVFMIGAPLQQANITANTPLAFIIQAVLFYLSGLLGRIRELYADAAAKEIFGPETVMIALAWYQKVWTDREPNISGNRERPRLQPESGTAFMSKGNQITYRSESLIGSVSLHKSQLDVLFAGGLAIGTNFAYVNSNGLEVIMFGTCVLAALLCVIYLLPYIEYPIQSKIEILKKVCVAASVFIAGVLTTGVILALVQSSVQALLEVPADYIRSEFAPHGKIFGLVLLSGSILALALAGTVPFIEICKKKGEKGLLPRRWSSWILVIPVAQTVTLFALIEFVFVVGYMLLNKLDPALLFGSDSGQAFYGLGASLLILEMVFILVFSQDLIRKTKDAQDGRL